MRTIEEIHQSFINGQRKQAVQQIDEYGLYDFFEDYSGFLYELYCLKSAFEYLTDAASSYHRIKNR